MPPVMRLKLAATIGSDFSDSISGWYLCVKLQENNRGGGAHLSSFYPIWFPVSSKKVTKAGLISRLTVCRHYGDVLRKPLKTDACVAQRTCLLKHLNL